jgi:hypothetical protein
METGRRDVVISCQCFILFAILLTQSMSVVRALAPAEESDVSPVKSVRLLTSLHGCVTKGATLVIFTQSVHTALNGGDHYDIQ